jgi:hypothetical protein
MSLPTVVCCSVWSRKTNLENEETKAHGELLHQEKKNKYLLFPHYCPIITLLKLSTVYSWWISLLHHFMKKKSCKSNILNIVNQEAQRTVLCGWWILVATNPQFQWFLFTCKINHAVLVWHITLSFILSIKLQLATGRRVMISLLQGIVSFLLIRNSPDPANVTKDLSIFCIWW